VVCFVDTSREGSEGREGRSAAFLEAVAADVVASEEAWISTVALGEAGPALRACITNFRTGPEDVDALVATLARARSRQAPSESGEES
jgi:hypothetical protein